MRQKTRDRLAALEARSIDHIAQLEVIDYGVFIEDYTDESKWKEVHHDQTVTVYRNRKTGTVRGVYNDRRDDHEILDSGGLLEYL